MKSNEPSLYTTNIAPRDFAVVIADTMSPVNHFIFATRIHREIKVYQCFEIALAVEAV